MFYGVGVVLGTLLCRKRRRAHAGRPGNLGTKGGESFNQDSGLNSPTRVTVGDQNWSNNRHNAHVETSCNASTLEWLAGSVLDDNG